MYAVHLTCTIILIEIVIQSYKDLVSGISLLLSVPPQSGCSIIFLAYSYVTMIHIEALCIGTRHMHCPRVGQVLLSGQTFYPRNNCPVGPNILLLSKTCPRDTFSWGQIFLRLRPCCTCTSVPNHKPVWSIDASYS